MPDSVLSPGMKLQSQRSILKEDKDKLKELVLGSQYLSGTPPRRTPSPPPAAAPPPGCRRIAPQVFGVVNRSCKPMDVSNARGSGSGRGRAGSPGRQFVHVA